MHLKAIACPCLSNLFEIKRKDHMADTAIKTEEEKKEYFDDPETLD